MMAAATKNPHNKEAEANLGERPKRCWGERHTFTLMSFVGLAVAYAIRFSLPIGIVAMVAKGDMVIHATSIKPFVKKLDPQTHKKMLHPRSRSTASARDLQAAATHPNKHQRFEI